MRFSFILIFLLISGTTFSQIHFPKEFKLIKGDNGSGEDDIYTNGRYSFDTHILFREYDFKRIDDSVKNFVLDFFGFPFYLTKDGLCWGSGKYQGFYSYVVVTGEGDLIELYSKYNDIEFSNYSSWLISTIRKYKEKGKHTYFPLRYGN